MIDIREIILRRIDLEDKDCFYSRSEFDHFRGNFYKKESSRIQNLDLITAATTCKDEG